jgi:hypothetical protein
MDKIFGNYAILGKKRKNSGAISRLFNNEVRKIGINFAIMETS